MRLRAGKRGFRALSAGLCLLAGVAVYSTDIQAEPANVITRCKKADNSTQIECYVRAIDGAGITSVTATDGERTLAVGPLRQAPEDPDIVEDSIAILFMVDTSKSMSAPAMAAIREQIAAAIAASKPRHRFGLATFNSDLDVLAGIGSDKSKILAAAASLPRDGDNTAFYEAIRKAVALMGRERSNGRFIVVMSDGEPEDRAYFPTDVIDAARAGQISISGIGFAGLPAAQSLPLQPLKRLVEETNGIFVAAGQGATVPADFWGNLFTRTDAGVKVEIDGAGAFGPKDIAVVVTDIDGRTQRTVFPMQFAGEPPLSARLPDLARKAIDEQPILVVAAALGLLFLLGLIVWLASRAGRQPLQPVPGTPDGTTTAPQGAGSDDETGPKAPALVYGHIDILEGSPPPRRVDITDSKVRIGRGPDNDLVLANDTVSNDHCVLTLEDDGRFEIRDVNSSNGTIVDGEPVGRAILCGGEHIVLGHVVLKFVMMGSPVAEPTATRLISD